MKVMLLSIKPKWLCRILNEKKIREVRKMLPYDYRGKVLVYCSKATNSDDYLVYDKINHWYCLMPKMMTSGEELNGKVVAIFNCDDITAYRAEFWEEPLWSKNYADSCYQGISEIADYPDDYDYYDVDTSNEFDSEDDLRNHSKFIKESCLTLEELKKFLGVGTRTFFAMKISNVQRFKNPIDLSKLHSYDMCTGGPSKQHLHNPPQNYCFVYHDSKQNWEDLL